MKKFITTILALASAFTAFADSITKTIKLTTENVEDVYIPWYCEPGDEWNGYLRFGNDAYGGMWRYATENIFDLNLAKHGFSSIDSVSLKINESFFGNPNTGAPNTYYNREENQYLKAFGISIWKGIDGDALDDSNNPDNYPLAMISGLSDVDLRNGITLNDIGLDDCDYILIIIEMDDQIIPNTIHSTDETLGFYMGGHKIELTLSGQEAPSVPRTRRMGCDFRCNRARRGSLPPPQVRRKFKLSNRRARKAWRFFLRTFLKNAIVFKIRWSKFLTPSPFV